MTHALRSLKVEHVIIAGHTNCGGVAVCIEGLSSADKACCFEPSENPAWPPTSPMDEWLQELRDLAQSMDPQPSVDKLVRDNVEAQVRKLMDFPGVKAAWEEGTLKGVHGWVYNLGTGLVEDLGVSVTRE